MLLLRYFFINPWHNLTPDMASVNPGVCADVVADLLVELVAAQDDGGALDSRVGPAVAQQLHGLRSMLSYELVSKPDKPIKSG